ncbi:MAG: winged helix-turn-helix transcriptional regulator [Firmicutes bacterium]|nr:winged helix-turn-helix transcriptional regulator [Bacillota bacterium]
MNKKENLTKIEILVGEREWESFMKKDGKLFFKKMGEKNLYLFKGKSARYNGMISEAVVQYMGGDINPYNLVNVFETHGLVIIPAERTIKKGNKQIVLKKQCMQMLEQLLIDSQVVHSRELLKATVKEKGVPMDDNALNACMCRLRRDLKEIDSEDLIKTYSSLGYKWVPEVKRFYR